MFSLIISIIAIALVIVLAGASLYYGGDAFNKGTSKGEAAKLINEAQQIQGAFVMHKVDEKGAEPADVAELSTDEYLAVDFTGEWTLSSDIAGTAATAGQTHVVGDAPSLDVCEEVNKVRDSGGNAQVSCNTDDLKVAYVL